MEKVKRSKYEVKRFGLYGIEYPAPPDPKCIAVRISTDWYGRIKKKRKGSRRKKMNSEELVPDIKLCKLIPKGEFEDSAFLCEAAVDMYTGETINIRIIPRPVRITSNPFVWHEMAREFHLFAAPTLEEIMAGLPSCTCYRMNEEWSVGLVNDSTENAIKDSSGTTAALKLWLKTKGIDYDSKF